MMKRMAIFLFVAATVQILFSASVLATNSCSDTIKVYDSSTALSDSASTKTLSDNASTMPMIHSASTMALRD